MHYNRLKVVWICHFTNSEMQNLLPLRKRRPEFASWIPNMIKGFENSNEIELYIISPHEHLKRTTFVKLRNINYYFIPFGIPILHRHWFRFLRIDILFNFYGFRKKVKYVIDKIKPAIINLIGAENSYYSSSIFDYFLSYPVLITIQGFISEFKNSEKLSYDIRNRIIVEEKILKMFNYFCGEQDSSNYINSYNLNHTFFKLYYPVNELLVSQTPDKHYKYDCIYFGRISKEKGTEDFIKVISEIKYVKNEVKACIIGSGNILPFVNLAKELNCENNIEFIGFVDTQKELFELVKSSRVFLAPPYNERLSSTLREAMLLKVPIVAYATGGIPYINEFDENIFLVKTGDYKEMARKTFLLLEDQVLASNLALKAYNYAVKEYSLNINSERLQNAYKFIINNFKNNGL